MDCCQHAERRSDENYPGAVEVILFVAAVVRHIAFMEKIPEIQCMSLKLIVKYQKHCGLCPYAGRKMVGVDLTFYLPRSIDRTQPGAVWTRGAGRRVGRAA
jgi:hypothetical protein